MRQKRGGLVFALRVALVGAVVSSAVGALAAALDGNWDLSVLFGVVLLSQAGIAGALLGRRRMTTLRVDLAQWADQRSALTGEPIGRIVDRCVAAYRDALLGRDA